MITFSGFGIRQGDHFLLQDINLELPLGMSHALVGERGSGKTLLLRACVGMWPQGFEPVGSLVVEGLELTALDEVERRKARQHGLMFLPSAGQSSLDPVERVYRHFLDVCSIGHRIRAGDARGRVIERAAILLRELGIADPDRVLAALPDELSGGMAKRVLLTMALLLQPRVLTADEPTMGLDVTIQRQILDLMQVLQAETGFTLLIATQNLGIVAHYASSIVLLDRGRIAEVTSPWAFFREPASAPGQRMLERARKW